MKKYILSIVVVSLSFVACNNSLQKEITEVEALLSAVKDSEASLFSVDTSIVFSVKRLMEGDLKEFHKVKDTLTKEESFRLDDIFASKKKIFRLESNYSNLIRQIEFSKKQLNNLKQDLENAVMRKEDFKIHFASEQLAVKELGVKINQSIQGLEFGLQKFELDRKELLEIIEKRKQKSVANE